MSKRKGHAGDELVAVVQKSQETMLETMKKLSERLERLELVRGRLGEQNTRQQDRQFTCWNCGKPVSQHILSSRILSGGIKCASIFYPVG